tara:strand:+ start:481 stop:648 length:168 start_codon:yes stop_codon:yes gene_type:complete
MDNAEEHGMFYQYRSKPKQHNKRISSLPSVAGTILRAAFASLNVPAHKLARYAGC